MGIDNHAGGGAADPAAGHVTIRMYGQGVGDCFLLAFPRRAPETDTDDGEAIRPVYVLIDCGVIGGTPGGTARMQQIVRDVQAQTRDAALKDGEGNLKGHLDLLVLTHEHWDHVSGFVQAKEQWQQIQVDKLWMAWTESEDGGELPTVLQKVLDKQRRALAAVADRAMQLGLSDRHATVLSLMGFLSDAAADGQAFAAAPTVGDAFQAARGLVQAPEARAYCSPGDVRPVPGTDTVAYVLGPPKSDARLRQMNPSRKDLETYEDESGAPHGPAGGAAGARHRAEDAGRGAAELAFALSRLSDGRSTLNAIAMPLLGPDFAAADDGPVDKDAYDLVQPFDRAVRVPFPTAEVAAADAARYPALASYFDEINHWRRIDYDWLGTAESFALQVDNLTNNTSLVLAFELPAGADGPRKVLLFTADAQVGNWLSWDEIPAWQRHDGARPSQATPDVPELLGRTAFYKVGHHGSHNATLKARGVERMPGDGTLTAFVPVSVAVARQIKKWGRMPLDVMLEALSQRAAGRVVLPTGDVWRAAPGQPMQQIQKDMGLTVSPDTLPAIEDRAGNQLQGPVPLWVEIAIPY